MRHPIADQFNYMNPGVQGQRQTDFVISRYQNSDYKHCALDIVNSAAYLAFLDPETAKDLDFSTEYFYSRVLERQQKEDIEDLVSIISESAYYSEDDGDDKRAGGDLGIKTPQGEIDGSDKIS